MKQANDLSATGIESGNIRPLEAITVNAGQGKIIDRSQSTMLKRDNVIDLEWGGMKRGRQLAVFATRLGSVPDFADESGVQRNRLLRRTPQGAPSLGLHHRQEVSNVDITVEFGLLFFRQLALTSQLR